MSAVPNDPNFWKRFSVAVHNSDLEKEELANKADLKHSYVRSLELSDAHSMVSPTSPSSQHPLTHAPLSPATLPPHPTSPFPHSPGANHTPTTPPAAYRPTSSRRLQKQRTKSTHRSSRRPSLANVHVPFTRHANASNLTLGLSGRPPSRFKFWTSVTADPSNRDSWLEGQRRKRKQRTWICWAFWLGFILLVGGVVAAILILKARGII